MSVTNVSGLIARCNDKVYLSSPLVLQATSRCQHPHNRQLNRAAFSRYFHSLSWEIALSIGREGERRHEMPRCNTDAAGLVRHGSKSTATQNNKSHTVAHCAAPNWLQHEAQLQRGPSR